jgi:hypothetical protein
MPSVQRKWKSQMRWFLGSKPGMLAVALTTAFGLWFAWARLDGLIASPLSTDKPPPPPATVRPPPPQPQVLLICVYQ